MRSDVRACSVGGLRAFVAVAEEGTERLETVWAQNPLGSRTDSEATSLPGRSTTCGCCYSVVGFFGHAFGWLSTIGVTIVGPSLLDQWGQIEQKTGDPLVPPRCWSALSGSCWPGWSGPVARWRLYCQPAARMARRRKEPRRGVNRAPKGKNPARRESLKERPSGSHHSRFDYCGSGPRRQGASRELAFFKYDAAILLPERLSVPLGVQRFGPPSIGSLFTVAPATAAKACLARLSMLHLQYRTADGKRAGAISGQRIELTAHLLLVRILTNFPCKTCMQQGPAHGEHWPDRSPRERSVGSSSAGKQEADSTAQWQKRIQHKAAGRELRQVAWWNLLQFCHIC